MGTTIQSTFTLLASNEDVYKLFKFVNSGTRFMSFFISIGIWVVVGYIVSKKASELGMSGALYFLLCFFLHVIGLVISLILIDRRKKELYNQSMRMNPNVYPNRQQYGGYGQPMQQPYNQQFYGQNYNQPYGEMYGQQSYTGKPMNAYNSQAIYCSSCGHQQADGNFCDVCGSRLR